MAIQMTRRDFAAFAGGFHELERLGLIEVDRALRERLEATLRHVPSKSYSV